MVYTSITVLLRPRNRKVTAQVMKEMALTVFSEKGVIRRFSNEGIMRPYRRFRDASGGIVHYARYVQMQVDLSDTSLVKFNKILRDHPDVLGHLTTNLEKPPGLYKNKEFIALDFFSRPEEELLWPPQASQDIYDQLDMNWKEFSRTRWSNYLRE